VTLNSLERRKGVTIGCVTTSSVQVQSPSPKQHLLRTPWLFLGLALLWSVVAIAVLLRYHVPEPKGVLSVTINGRTYLGNPPALTLFQKDLVSFVTVAIVLGTGLLVATVDLVMRSVQRSSRTGTLAIVAGGAVVLVSLFGLLVGLVGVGVVGVLLIFSGLAGGRNRTK
jgi:hypothetical protein